jgi:hypothetical protein
MGAQLLGIEGTQVKIEVTINLSRSMLTSEEKIQESFNRSPLPRQTLAKPLLGRIPPP